MPLVRWVETITRIAGVENLTAAHDTIAIRLEVLGNGEGVRQQGPEPLGVAVYAGCGRQQAGHRGSPGWIAGGGRAMGIGEERSSLGKTINVGRLDVGMSAKASHPVLHVVHRYEQHIGLVRFLGERGLLRNHAPSNDHDKNKQPKVHQYPSRHRDITFRETFSKRPTRLVYST